MQESHTSFLSKSTDYLSHMLLQRWEAKIRRKESSPQPGIEFTSTRSWVRHAHRWAIRPGLKRIRNRDISDELCMSVRLFVSLSVFVSLYCYHFQEVHSFYCSLPGLTFGNRFKFHLQGNTIAVNKHSLLHHSHTKTLFDAPGKQAFWKHCGKRRNCS